jgi:alpha-1,2-mannosyltransferase
MLAWPPLHSALDIGNWEAILLAICVLAWESAERGKDAKAGVLFGLAAALKIYPALLLLPYVFRLRLRLCLVAGLTFPGAQAVTLLLFGPSTLVRYWTEVLPSVSRLYSTWGTNISLFGGVLRLLGGGDLPAPLFAPGLALPLSALGGVLAILLSRSARPQAAAALPVLVGLTAWSSYLVLALPCIIDLWRSRRLAARLAVILSSVSLGYVVGILAFGPLVILAMPPLALLLSLLPSVGAFLILSSSRH